MRPTAHTCVVGLGRILFAFVLTIPLVGQTPDPILGTWTLNLAKSSFDPGPPPKQNTVTFTTVGRSIKIVTKGIDGAGKPTATEITYTSDGKDYPITGTPDYDSVAYKQIDARTTEATRKRAGKVVQTVTRVLSADGKSYTVTVKGTDAKGQRINNVSVFDKR